MTQLKNLDRRMITILLIIFVQILGASMILPILPLLAKREFAMSDQTITLLVTTYFGAQFLAGPTLGRLSDRYGRVPVLIISQIGTTISFLMLVVAPSVGWLFMARLFDGITGGNIIVARAYVVDITEPEKRTEALSLIFAAFGLGFILGPALGGLLSAAFGLRFPYILAAIAAAIVVLMTWRTLDETVTEEDRLKSRQRTTSDLSFSRAIRNHALLQLLLVAFIGQFGFALLQSTFSLFGEAVLFADYSIKGTSLGIGLLLASVGIMQVVTQTVIVPRLLKIWSEAQIIVFGSVVRGLGMFILAMITSPYLAVITTALFAMGQGSMMPSLNSLTTRTVSEELRGEVQGVYQSTLNLAVIFSTAIAGVIFAIKPSYPYFLGAGISLLAILPMLGLIGRSRAPKVKNATI